MSGASSKAGVVHQPGLASVTSSSPGKRRPRDDVALQRVPSHDNSADTHPETSRAGQEAKPASSAAESSLALLSYPCCPGSCTGAFPALLAVLRSSIWFRPGPAGHVYPGRRRSRPARSAPSKFYLALALRYFLIRNRASRSARLQLLVSVARLAFPSLHRSSAHPYIILKGT